ncbi:MAG: hypothetical protein WC087_01105 [Candidatus Paceibacterota bacterium]
MKEKFPQTIFDDEIENDIESIEDINETVKRLNNGILKDGLKAFSSDILPYVKRGEGDRIIIIKEASLEEMINVYELGDAELDYMHTSSHFRTDKPLEVYSWMKISQRNVVSDLGVFEKAWLIEEIQSDLLQKTKNKKLKEVSRDKCEMCNGKGGVNVTKTEYVKCNKCFGAGSIPNYQKELLEDVKSAAKEIGVDVFLMPTSETILEQYAGLMKDTKAKLLYETVPESIDFERVETNEISLSREEGEPVNSRVFWKKKI